MDAFTVHLPVWQTANHGGKNGAEIQIEIPTRFSLVAADMVAVPVA